MGFTTEQNPQRIAVRCHRNVRLPKPCTLIRFVYCVPKRKNMSYKPQYVSASLHYNYQNVFKILGRTSVYHPANNIKRNFTNPCITLMFIILPIICPGYTKSHSRECMPVFPHSRDPAFSKPPEVSMVVHTNTLTH